MFTAEKIREIRTRLRMTGAEFGAKLGVSENTVRRWEMGIRHPCWDTMLALSQLEEKLTDKPRRAVRA